MSERDADLFDKKRPRLEAAQTEFFDLSPHLTPEERLGKIQDFYLTWRNYDEYYIMQKTTMTSRGEKKEFYAGKCNKRGNDVYYDKLAIKLRKIIKTTYGGKIFNPNPRELNLKTNMLFITLTYDPKMCSVRDAWKNIGRDFYRWINNIRNKYGEIKYMRAWEAFPGTESKRTARGYPHIHLALIFKDAWFNVFYFRGKWRIKEKSEFEKSYHSFVDVEACWHTKKGFGYVSKYLTKTRKKDAQNNQDLTNSLCWIFRKQSYGLTKNLKEALKRLVNGTINNYNSFSAITTPLKPDNVLWEFLGLVPASILYLKPYEWRKKITDSNTIRRISEVLYWKF